MVTFEKAVKTAKETRGNVNHYQEYKDLYVFSDKSAESSIGGYDAPFIIMKSSGKVFGYSYIAVTQSQKLFEENLIKEGDL